MTFHSEAIVNICAPLVYSLPLLRLTIGWPAVLGALTSCREAPGSTNYPDPASREREQTHLNALMVHTLCNNSSVSTSIVQTPTCKFIIVKYTRQLVRDSRISALLWQDEPF